MTDVKAQFDIGHMAKLLKARKRGQGHMVLVLGSRTCSLFHNSKLYEIINIDEDVTFNDLSETKRFAASYQRLTHPDANLSTGDLYSILTHSLKNIEITEADICLAELIKSGVFDIILTTTMDNTLEAVGLREWHDFEVFSLHPHIEKEQLRFDKDVPCHIIKVFGQLTARDYTMQRREYFDQNQSVRQYIEHFLTGELIIIGLDAIWDAEIEQIFPMTGGVLWLVNEELPDEDGHLFHVGKARDARYLADIRYGYQQFFPELYRQYFHILPDRPEIKIIDDAFSELLDRERNLRNPIINLYGVSGIGKSSILEGVRQQCGEQNLHCITLNMKRGFSEFGKIIAAHSHILPRPLHQLESREPIEQFVGIAKELLAQGPLVILLESVDVTNEKQIERLETILAEFVLYSNLLVILTSHRSITFERKKSVARRLTTIAVQPLDRDTSHGYLENMGYAFTEETRELIFTWTRGYPLAMRVVAEALTKEGINLGDEQEQKRLVVLMIEHVINQSILAGVAREDLAWYLALLSLLAVPRRFNLLMMQRLIEQFEPTLRLASNLAYMALSRKITRDTGILDWDLVRAGLTLDRSVRTILLLHLKTLYPERYTRINHFLMVMNRENAMDSEIRGLDRIQYRGLYLLRCQR